MGLFNSNDEYKIKKVNEQLAEIVQVSVKEYGIISDGVTDQTQELITLFTGDLLNFNGCILIPFNVKFDASRVYPNIPLGAYVDDKSMVNMYNSPTYKQKYVNIGSSDKVDNDFVYQLLSGHHPAFVLNNLGTSGSESASMFRNTIMFAHGLNTDGTLKNHMLNQIYNNGSKWLWTVRALEKYADGAQLDTTIISVDEDGHFALNSTPSYHHHSVQNRSTDTDNTTSAFLGNTNISSNVIYTFESKKSDGTVVKTDITQRSTGVFAIERNGKSLMEVTDNGFLLPDKKILKWRTISGATPDVSNGVQFFVNNADITTITDLTGVANQEIRLIFQNGNTTLQNGSSIRLKSGVNWTPTQYSSITLVKNSSVTSGWIEVSRTEM